jgi:alanine dehydrogenase
LAYKNDKIVGRIAVIINHKEERIRDQKVRFGWIDFIDDEEVSKALIQKQLIMPKRKILIRLKDQWASPILTKQEC